jgi:hypothetical protein
MKKIYFLTSILLTVFFTACQDYNNTNFPGYNQAAIPTNLVNTTYTMVPADYSTIATAIKKPVNDSITLMKTNLKNAKTKTDSTAIQTIITKLNDKLNTDSTMLAAKAIADNKIFLNQKQFSKWIPVVLISKYPFCDAKSVITVNFNQNYDTTKIATTDKYTLVTADYDAMGTGINAPGQYDNFSSAIDPNFYLPIFLKTFYLYAKSGDLKLIRYKYYNGKSTVQYTSVFKFDGSSWSNSATNSSVNAKFIFKDKVWQFYNTEIYAEKFTKDISGLTPVVVKGTYTWTWGAFNNGCAVANAYQKGETEIWLVTPSIDLSNRPKANFSFDYAINYATGLPISDLASVYVSTDYTTDVTKATWTKLNLNYPSNFVSSWTFINTGKIDLLSAYAGKKITIGFKYVSTGTAIAWEISNILVSEE